MAVAYYCPRCLNTFSATPEQCPSLICGAARPGEGWPALLGPGDVLDRTYKIHSRLAGGAAGMTYHAQELGPTEELIGPELAIKVLYQQRDSGPFLRRLATEAQILQELNHPHIVECLGFVHRAGRPPYLVTRFEAGGTLHGHLQRVGPLHPGIAASIVLQILDALEVAHQADVVHRDLKPGNILLRAQVPAHEVPVVLLADFGIARISGSLGGMTRVGTFVGTPEYAAPEQFLGLEPTSATDLYAAGAVLWTCLTGRPPNQLSQRNDPAQCHDELVALLPPPLPPEIPRSEPIKALQPVIDGLLLPDPAHRWSTERARAVLREVVRLAHRHGHPADGPSIHPDHEPPPSSFADPHGTFLWEEEDAVLPEVGEGGTLFADTPEPPPKPAARRRERPKTPPPSQEPPPKSSMEGLFDFDDDDPFDPDAEPPSAPTAPEPSSAAALDAASDAFAADAPTQKSQQAHHGRHQRRAQPGLDAAFEPDRHPFEPRANEPLDEPEPEGDPFEDFFSGPPDPRRLLQQVGTTPDSPLPPDLDGLNDRVLSEALRKARSDDDPRVRRGAALVAGALHRTEQITLLRALLRDPIPTVRAEAVAALGHLAQGSALPHLARALDDREPSVRAQAAFAIAEAYARDGDVRRGRQQLSKLAADRHPEVRDAFAAALARLDQFGD
ncbi:MAG: hypothetical protein EA397_17775 [Deltaproteobacteria bacterium]|nr:MAG: hypothetical protein EA397_17775 [Deltaproteobacteria bacterium]